MVRRCSLYQGRSWQGSENLLLPPDYQGTAPEGFLTFRSRTYGVFVFWRGFFKDPKQLEEPVRVMEQTKNYPLGKEGSAKAMQFPNASAKPANLLYATDGTAFDILARFIEHEYPDPADKEMRGMLATLGIVKGQKFEPDAHTRELFRARGANGDAYQPRHQLRSLAYPNQRILV